MKISITKTGKFIKYITIMSNEKQSELCPDAILAEVIHGWMDNCPLVSGWCRYNGRVYYADLNYEESEKAQKPIFDLAYCATKAMNNIYLLRRDWDAKKFRRWKDNSNW